MNTLNLGLFHWHGDTQTLSAEISELSLNRIPPLIEVVNEKSKQFRKFKFERTETDREGDILSWRYVGDGNSLKLIIWND